MKTNPKKVLAEFCADIDATGGVVELVDGNHAPAADEDWIDLAETYLRACEALGRKPKVRTPCPRSPNTCANCGAEEVCGEDIAGTCLCTSCWAE